jgi:hypothetical protein
VLTASTSPMAQHKAIAILPLMAGPPRGLETGNGNASGRRTQMNAGEG